MELLQVSVLKNSLTNKIQTRFKKHIKNIASIYRLLLFRKTLETAKRNNSKKVF
jgi:hypothetical protein